MGLVRFVLQCLIALFLLSVVIAIFAQESSTGTAEKIVLGLLGVGLICAAAYVRRLGTKPEADV